MTLREVLNRFPAITTALTLLIIAVAVGFIVYSQRPAAAAKPPTKCFYTTDDGKSWFADDYRKLPPFTKDGKEAVRAWVMKCKDVEFVAYMERFTPEAKAELERIYTEGGPNGANKISPEQGSRISQAWQNGLEYKRPGEADWFFMHDDFQRFGKMMGQKCPDSEQLPMRVEPAP